MCDTLEENKYILSQQTEDSESTSNHVDHWEVVDRVQMFDFVWPKAGMFVWVEVLFENHRLRSQYSAQRLSKAFWVHLTKKPHLCLIGPGSMFAATSKSATEAHKYFRIAFAPMDAEDVAPFTSRLVEGFRAFWQRKNLDGLEDEDAAVAIQSLQLGPGANFLGTGY
jgi:aspartate/methionine/tyrosine aminotransferase